MKNLIVEEDSDEDLKTEEELWNVNYNQLVLFQIVNMIWNRYSNIYLEQKI